MANLKKASAAQEKFIERIRAYCLSLPEAVETESFGEPWFRARKKAFAVLDMQQQPPQICLKVGKADQALFLADPRFRRAPYVGKHGYVMLTLDPKTVPMDEIRELILLSYRNAVPKTLLKLLPAG